jgi:hypothetical protein
MKANMKASQGKMEVSQEEMVTTRPGQEKLEVAMNAIQYAQYVQYLDTEIQETQLDV